MTEAESNAPPDIPTMKLNTQRLVEMAVTARVANPIRFGAFEMDAEGHGHSLPSVGGIVYNVKVGDPAFGWQGDHIEPCVSMLFDEEKRSGRQNMAVQFLACIGNQVTVISGPAKGAKGVVTGLHGGVEHVLVDFPDVAIKKMTGEEKFLIRGFGQGLRVAECPDVFIYNLDPSVLQKMGVKIASDGVIEVPVTHMVPAALMGSGLGHGDPGTGDYDITTQDPKSVKEHKLDSLCFGDFVAIMDADNTYGRHYYSGAVTIAIVSHSDSFLSGHGPGVTTLISARNAKVRPVLSKKANLGRILKIGKYRSK